MLNHLWKIIKKVVLFIIMVVAIPLDFVYWNLIFRDPLMNIKEIVKSNWSLYKKLTGIRS